MSIPIAQSKAYSRSRPPPHPSLHRYPMSDPTPPPPPPVPPLHSTSPHNFLPTSATPSPPPVFSTPWYQSLRPEYSPSPYTTPPGPPAFFRVRDPTHLALFGFSNPEADLLYQALAFLHVDANRLVEAIDQLTVQDLPATAVPAIESIDAAWRDMSGIRELLQTRYDILAATASGDTDLARALRRLSIPAIGNGLLCTGVDAQRRELARGGDYAERGAPSGSEARGSDGRESGVRETWTGNDPDCEFVYMLRHYDLVKERRSYSPWYVCNQFRWRLLMFPRRDHGLDEYMSVYLQCGGPVTEETEKIAETESEKGNTSWHCSVKFGLHLLHSSSPLAIACKEMKEEDACYRAIDLRSRSMASGPARGECADIVEEFYHVFRETSDDWGYELAPFSILQPGKYADHDMNLVFMVRIQVEGK